MEKVCELIKTDDGGHNYFLTTQKVRETSRILGADDTIGIRGQTPANTERGAYDEVEFRIAEVANLLFPDIYRYAHM